MAPPRPEDKKAGYIGLIVALLFIGTVVFGMVQITNRYVASKGEAHATQQAH
jgi:hypothetical protein